MIKILVSIILVVLACTNPITCQSRKELIVLKYKSNVTLECSSLRDPEFYQIKNGSIEERKYEGNEKNVHIENGKLTLNDLRGEEINAEYLCRSKNDHSKKIEYVKRIAPYLFKPEKASQTVSEGNRVDFKCTLLFGNENKEAVQWEWHRNGSRLDSSADGRVQIVSGERETTLSINKVNDGDKGEYECHVKNRFGEHSEAVHLRVKDALAALWPFLAIVAEVLILCIILFIYEKKCSKKRNNGEDENEQTQNLMGRDGNADLKKRTVKA